MTNANTPNGFTQGCCNATTATALASLNRRIESERQRGVGNPDFIRGLEVAKTLIYEALERR